MKVFLLALVVLIAVNYASAQVDSAQAWRAQAEANFYINVLKAKAVFYKDVFRNNLVIQANLLIIQMNVTKFLLAARFWIFGSKAQAQRIIWMGDMDDLVSSLTYQLSFQSVDAILNPTLNQLRATFLDPRQGEIEDMKTAINAHTTQVLCWDNNKGAINSLTNKLVAEGVVIMDGQVNNIKSALIAITSNIKSIGEVFNQDLIGCGIDQVCGYNYIQKNYGNLTSDIKAQTTAASKALRTSIANIFGNITATTKDIEDEYKAGPKAQITACFAKG